MRAAFVASASPAIPSGVAVNKKKKKNRNKRRARCSALPTQAPPGPQSPVELARRTCATCSKMALKMLRCSRCKAAFYCDAACQKRHWREHKAACGAAAST